MIRAINPRKYCQNISNKEDHSLSYDKPDLCNDYTFMEQDKANQFSISFPRHCVFGYVLSNTNPLNEVDSWKEEVRPSKKPRSVDPCRSNPIQTVRKTTNNKKLQQKNKKSRSVTIQASENLNNKNKESRSDNTPGYMKPRNKYTPNNSTSTISDLQKLRSVDDCSTPQHMISIAGHPKNRLYINSATSLYILFNKELLGELHNIDKPLKIRAGGKLFHIKQV